MIQRICDRCGNRIDEGEDYIHIEGVNFDNATSKLSSLPPIDLDKPCMRDFRAWLKTKPTA